MMFISPKKHFTSKESQNHGNSNQLLIQMHLHMNAFIFLNGKVFVTPNFDDLDLNKLGLKFWDVTNLPPLNKISSRDLQRKLGTKEIWELCPNVIFSLPSSFLLGMVAPLNLEKLDTPGPGGSVGFF